MDPRETAALSVQAQRRLTILSHLLAGRISAEEAATALRLSERQVRRLLAAYAAEGPAGLQHGNAGRAPAHRTPDAQRERLVALATGPYAGVNHAHLADLLAEREGIRVPERTLRRLLADAGVHPVRTRRPPRHRSRRERMPRAGMLLQVDGSRHDWLEGRGPWLTLVGGIDDATGTVTGGTFRAQEDAAGYLVTFGQTATGFGLPMATYSDRHGIFWRDRRRPPTLTEQLTGQRSFTQVGRALHDAGITWIGARSPQAKGRVERLWGTLQDRLVSELRLAHAATLEEANVLLAAYLPRHNARFAVPAADPVPAWRPLPEGTGADALFCFHYPRRVARDATVSWSGGALALPRRRDGRSWAGCAVVVEERLDGSLWVRHEGVPYPLRDAPPGPALLRARHLSARSAGQPDLLPPLQAEPEEPAPRTPWRPAPDHPWRR